MIARFQALKLAPWPRSLAPTWSLMPVRLGPSTSLIPFAPFSVLRWFVASALLLNGLAIAQITSADDENAAITKTALDYIEGWYAGDAARMERALHPELAKRMISIDPKIGRSQFNHTGAMALIQRTRDGGGKNTPPDRQLKEVTILDRYNNAAVVKIVASDWIDYLEVAKFNGDWKIINVLWELKPKTGTSESTPSPQK